MKKKILALTVVSLMALLVSNAFAVKPKPPYMSLIDTYNNASNSGVDDIFTPGETVFVGFRENEPGNKAVNFSWYLKNGANWDLIGTDTFAKGIWNTFTKVGNKYFLNTSTTGIWDTIKQSGNWKVEGWGDTQTLPHQTALFSLVPEPISTTLFLLGGGVLGLHMYRRKKKAA